MTIIDFYKKLSTLLTDTREKFLSQEQAETKLDLLLEEANKNGLDVQVSKNVLDPIFLMRLDDERSFRQEDDDYYDYNDSDFSLGGDSSF
jgi:hypothetical protein